MRFTQSAIDNFESPKGKPNHDEWDDSLSGFGIRVEGGGPPVYIVECQIGGKDHVLLLGKIGKIKLKLAKQIAEQILSLVAIKVREITKKKCDPDPVPRPTEEKIAVEEGRAILKNEKKPQRFLSYFELEATRGIRFTRQHLHRLEASNKFPKRVKIGEHHIAWIESEIDEYLEKRIAERG